MTSVLPPASRRTGAPYRIAVVCLGNICRSPMADVVLNDRLQRAELAEAVEVISAGTGHWHVGGPMDDRAAALLTRHGYDATRHRARQFDPSWFDDVDLVLAMDSANYADVTRLGPATSVRMFRDFDPLAEEAGDRDVPDPYFGGDDGFEAVLEIIERTSDALVQALRRSLRRPAGNPAISPGGCSREAGG
jgi:protein-tyrosine phosphatase